MRVRPPRPRRRPAAAAPTAGQEPRGRSVRVTMVIGSVLTTCLAVVSAALVGAAPATAATQGPCDIYASGGTPCVAAHSTTRALYGSYHGALYQVQRASDGQTSDIGVVAAGGIANSAAQDTFCASTSCVITKIYDQSGRGNNLDGAATGYWPGPEAGNKDSFAPAAAAPVYLGGKKVYGVFVAPGTGYRNNATNGIATGDQPEGMYEVLDPTHFDGDCCFDYGNAETSGNDDGNGTMESIYFGNDPSYGRGAGNGPWTMADLENGLFPGATGYNADNPSITGRRFQTALVKGGSNQWAIRGGDSQSPSLSTSWSGARPSGGYNPMNKQGAIVLGVGGDNSNNAAGTFYEGVMTSGYPSDSTENAVQADIAAAAYTAPANQTLTAGSTVSIRATTACCTHDYVQHSTSDTTVNLATATTATTKAASNWIVRAGLADSSCYSFESADRSGQYLRHSGFQGYLAPNDGSSGFAGDATFCLQPGNSGQGVSFRSSNFPDRWLRHFGYRVDIARHGGGNPWDSVTSFPDDTSFVVGGALS